MLELIVSGLLPSRSGTASLPGPVQGPALHLHLTLRLVLAGEAEPALLLGPSQVGDRHRRRLATIGMGHG
jgi:hypothetical protein